MSSVAKWQIAIAAFCGLFSVLFLDSLPPETSPVAWVFHFSIYAFSYWVLLWIPLGIWLVIKGKRKVDPEEAQKVLELLGRRSNLVAGIDAATDKTRLATAQHGMHSDAFEEARIAAIGVVDEAQKQTRDYGFWPVLEDDEGVKSLLDLQKKVETSYGHQLLLLRLQGEAAEAFRTGQDSQAPSMQDINTANKNFERILDEIGKSGGKLARHYKIRVQDIQSSLD